MYAKIFLDSAKYYSYYLNAHASSVINRYNKTRSVSKIRFDFERWEGFFAEFRVATNFFHYKYFSLFCWETIAALLISRHLNKTKKKYNDKKIKFTEIK